MVTTVQTKGWRDFKKRIDRYLQLSTARREQFIFRGQTDNRWKLTAKLDRVHHFRNVRDRQQCIDLLVRAFKRASVGVLEDTAGIADDLEWELLGRHHGLPTPFLDWTESPYMAAFFAFDDSVGRPTKYVSIWALDCEVFELKDVPAVELIDSDDLVRFNLRAVEQRAVFLRVNDASKPFEHQLGNALVRYDVPASDKEAALSDLDSMNVNARVLFRNLDGAARLADRRILLLGEK